MPQLNLSFCGLSVLFRSNNEKLIEDTQRDFSFFKSEACTPQITINAYNSRPPYVSLPPMQASYVSPRNICYYYRGIKYIDYSGNGLVIYNKKEGCCDIYSDNYSLLNEACYMTILSLVSDKLDKRHIHRVHGLGLAIDNKAIIVLLDMGGGKTTLAMSILSQDNNLKLISEDSPLINPKGQILPFPLRIGMRPEDVPSSIPQEYRRYFEREEFRPKTLIDIDYLKNRICNSPCRPYMVIIGRRTLGTEPQIKPCSKYQALKEFIKNSVIGLGLYQGIEYVFQKGPKEVIKKIPLGLSRLNNSLKLINKSKIFEIILGPDKEKNSQILINFLAEESKRY